MEIRFFQKEDLEIAIDIFEALSEYYLGDNSSSRKNISRNLNENILADRSGVELILAVDQGKSVGMAAISLLYPAPKETAQLFIKELFVLPDCHSKGIGKKMMQFIAEYALENKCSRIDLSVDLDNEKAIQFYKSLGVLPLETKLYLRAEHDVIAKLAKDM